MKLSLRLFLIFMCIGAGSVPVEAALGLSVSPLSGGSTLRFGRVDPSRDVNQEVRVRITSTDGLQYQVFQRLEQSLVNEQGQPLNNDAVQIYTISGSNGSGSLYAQTPEPLSLSEQLIYTSNSAGDSDSFIVVYNASARRISGRGQFTGAVSYTVRAFGSTDRDTVILNVYLDAGGELLIDVSGSRAEDRVKVAADDSLVAEYVTFSYEGHFGGAVRIYQEMDGLMRNEKMETLRPEWIQVQTLGPAEGTLMAQVPAALAPQRVLLYEGGAARDQFQVRYRLNPDSEQLPPAGRYSAPVRYIIEAGGQVVTRTVNLEAEIDRLFQLEADFPAGGVQFRELLPGGPEQVHEVLLTVAANTGEPYMIAQKTAAPMTSAGGYVLEDRAFEVRQEILKGEGKAGSGTFTPVKVGETPVYISDSQGAPAEVKVYYRLTPYETMRAGDYSTVIQYSLSEL
jgi:hypothetical protein